MVLAEPTLSPACHQGPGGENSCWRLLFTQHLKRSPVELPVQPVSAGTPIGADTIQTPSSHQEAGADTRPRPGKPTCISPMLPGW